MRARQQQREIVVQRQIQTHKHATAFPIRPQGERKEKEIPKTQF